MRKSRRAGNSRECWTVFFRFVETSMPENIPSTFQLVLTRDASLGRITVDMQAFFDFSFDLAEDLQDLVERWQHVTPKRPPRDRMQR